MSGQEAKDDPTPEGRRRALVILEVLGGTRSPAEAAEALGLSVTRYYALEATALDGLSRACEPHPQRRGRKPDPAKEMSRLEAERNRLEAENARFQALLRSLQRTVGVKASPSSKPAKKGQQGQKGGKRRKRKTTVRALVAAKKLRGEAGTASPSPSPGRPERHVAAAAEG